MAKLKRKVSKSDFDSFDDGLKSFYLESDDGYSLDAEDRDDGPLKRAKDRESQEKKDAQAKVKELQAKIDGIGTEDARKNGDIDTLYKSFESRTDALKSEFAEKSSKKDNIIKELLVDSVAEKLAYELSPKSGHFLVPQIIDRLHADMDADKPTTRVLDKDGNPSLQTLAELKKELIADERNSAIIEGSKASGSGATGSKGSNGSAKSLKDMTAAEEIAYSKEDPQRYEVEAKEHYGL